jgi:predicted nucleic acid-binding protein
MAKFVLDTSVLLHWWNERRSRHRGPVTVDHAQAWGRALAAAEKTTAIVTPVLIEVVGGTTRAAELRLMRAFLEPFVCVDGQRITAHDWEEARRLAQRVPRDRRPRQLGDCLIRAIANRLHYEVRSGDTAFPG